MAELTAARLSEHFERFLKSFRDSGGFKYRQRVSDIVGRGGKSLLVDFEDLFSYNSDLTLRLLEEPDEVLPNFDTAVYEALRVQNASYAEKVRKSLKARIRSLPTRLSLRAVTTEHLNKLISVSGMTVRTSELKPLVVEAAFKCRRAGHINVVTQTGFTLRRPRKCAECDEAKFFELDQKQSVFIDYQVMRIQELPEELPPGQLPQSFDVSVSGDMVDSARPGDRVILTGVVKAEPEFSFGGGRTRTTSSVFRSRIDANFVETLGKEPEAAQISKEDEEAITSVPTREDAYERLIESVAPAIHGYDTQKEAILLLTVGSPRRVLPDGATIRGDINILMVGDPGTAKSELLKYASRIAPRGLYTSGRGTTAAGLTAAVVREKTGMMMLEAGAVVLADQGLACIDEFDKMRPEDRNALHECMEQQTVSVAKGGIVATLNARTSILAALNPVLGKYDPYRNITENVTLPIPLLTRFDLIFAMRDVPDRVRDEALAKHVMEIHRKGDYVTAPPFSHEFLKKYLSYSKKVNPALTKEAEEKIIEYYLQMRSTGSESMITVTPRQLEALVRLSTARARILLRERVTEDDALKAIGLMNKMLQTVGVDVRTGRVDLGVLHGRPLSERTLIETAIDVFKSLEGTEKRPVEGSVFVEELMKTGKFNKEDAQRMLNNLNRSGQIYEVKPGSYKKL